MRTLYLSLLLGLLCSCELLDSKKEGEKRYKISGIIMFEGGGQLLTDFLVKAQQDGQSTSHESKLTGSDGRYEIDNLPAGKYTITVSGWGIEEYTERIDIPGGETHDILVTQTIIKPQIYQNSVLIEQAYDMTDYPTRNFDILNGNRETMHWSAHASEDEWLSVSPQSGDVPANEQDYGFTITIDRDKLEYDTPPATITVNSNKGSVTIQIRAQKPGAVGKATVSVLSTTADNVVLKATANGANSFEWYWGSDIVPDQTGDTYQVFQRGVYYATGVSAQGIRGVKSEGVYADITASTKPAKPVITGAEINSCPFETVSLNANSRGANYFSWSRDGKDILGISSNITANTTGDYTVEAGNIEGLSPVSEPHRVTIVRCPTKPSVNGTQSMKNTCPEMTVKLEASSTNATSYQWSRGSTVLEETSAILVVNQTGTYWVRGVNKAGLGEAVGRSVEIVSCAPANPAGVSARMSDSGIAVSWNSVYDSSMQYKIEICDNVEMKNCDRVLYADARSYSNTYEIEADMLYCGMNYIRVTAVKNGLESDGVVVTCNWKASVSAPTLSSLGSYIIYWTGAKTTGTSAPVYYDVLRRRDLSSAWEVIAEKLSGTQYNIPVSIDDGFTTAYQIRAWVITSCGEQEAFSNSESAHI